MPVPVITDAEMQGKGMEAATEDRLMAMSARHSGSVEQPMRHGATSSERLVNGPRLDGESGHASQRDIDVMFA